MYSILRIFLLFGLFVSSPGFITRDEQLFEGSLCWLENRVRGLCKKLSDCPTRMALVAAGQWKAAESKRCGFDKFVEIVCCPFPVFLIGGNSMSQVELRASGAACKQYQMIESDKGFGIAAYGGTPAITGEFPYMAALGYKDTDAGGASSGAPLKYTCGGTLISAKHVLTAAHCVNNINKNVPVEVHLGNADLRAESPTVQRIPISNIVSHPQYKRGINYDDLAIITLSKTAQFNENVKPICLETKIVAGTDTSESTLSVIGFGLTDPFDIMGSPKLIKVTGLSLVETETCRKSYEDFVKLPNGVNENMLCAVDSNKTRLADACEGDSGGPLLMRTGTVTTIIGITAFGRTCGSTDPGVYMAIHPYLDWIEKQVWPDGVPGKLQSP